MLVSVPLFRLLLFQVVCLGMAPAVSTRASEIGDQPVPGAEGGSLTVQVEAGRAEKEFHLTFQRDGAYHVSFDGAKWSAPLQITMGRPFRSGVHMAVDRDRTAHFAWVEGGGDHNGTVYYRTARAGKLGPTETVHTPQGWNECDIAIDDAGSPVIAANTATTSQMAVYERTDSGWKPTILPSDNELYKWAPFSVRSDPERPGPLLGSPLVGDGSVRSLATDPDDRLAAVQGFLDFK